MLSALYVGAVLLLLPSPTPTSALVEHGPWLEYRLSPKSRELLEGKGTSAGIVNPTAIERPTEPWSSDPIVVTGANGHTFDLPARTTKEQAAAFTEDYNAVLADEASAQRRANLKSQAFALLGPPLFLLLLGLAISWVRRGFRGNEGAP